MPLLLNMLKKNHKFYARILNCTMFNISKRIICFDLLAEWREVVINKISGFLILTMLYVNNTIHKYMCFFLLTGKVYSWDMVTLCWIFLWLEHRNSWTSKPPHLKHLIFTKTLLILPGTLISVHKVSFWCNK